MVTERLTEKEAWKVILLMKNHCFLSASVVFDDHEREREREERI